MKHSPVRGSSAGELGDGPVGMAHDERQLPPLSAVEPGRLRDQPQPEAVAAAKKILRCRRLRNEVFGNGLFADAPWDMLLELYVTHLMQQRVSVTSICHASEVPTSTALRWLKSLEDLDLVVRRPDPLDRRRIFVELSEQGAARMNALFDAILRVPGF